MRSSPPDAPAPGPDVVIVPEGWASRVADAVSELIVVVDATGLIVYGNQRVWEFLGGSASDWIGRSGIEVVHPGDVPIAAELMVTARTNGLGVKEPVTYRFRRSDGAWADVEVVATHVERSGESFLVLSGRHVGRRPSAPIVDEVAGRLSQAFEQAAIGMAQVGLDGRLMRANARLSAKLGVAADALSRSSLAELVAPEDRAAFQRRWDGLVGGGDPQLSIEVRLATPRSEIHAHVTGSIVHDRLGQPMYVALQVVDVTERVEAERSLLAVQQELVHRSNHDPLTGLGNRQLLGARMAELGSLDAGGTVGVLYLDLDGFKAVNDSLGHRRGDELLVVVADRIRGATRPDDTTVRLGGDEFVIVARFESARDAQTLAERLLRSFDDPFRIGTTTVAVGCSIGIALASTADSLGSLGSLDELIDRADRALYLAKRDGRSRYRIATLG